MRSVAWAQAKSKALGFYEVWLEPVTFPMWVRRNETVDVVGTHARPLKVPASGSNPAGAISADDTLDTIDPKALAQNVSAYAVFAYLAAEADGDFGSEARAVVPPRE